MVTFNTKSLMALFTVVTLSTTLAIAKQETPLKKLDCKTDKAFSATQKASKHMHFHSENDLSAPAVDLDPNYNYDSVDEALLAAAEELVADALDTTALVVETTVDAAGDVISAGAAAAGQLVHNIGDEFTEEDGHAHFVVHALQDSANFVGEQATAFEASVEHVAGHIGTEITELATAGEAALQNAVTSATHAIEEGAEEVANNKYVVRIKNAICSAFSKTKTFAENNHGKITTILAAAIVYLIYQHHK